MTTENNSPDPQAANQTRINLHRTDPGNRVLAHVVIGDQPLVIDQSWLAAALDSAGLKGAVISKNGILKLQRMVSSRESGEVEIGECHNAEVSLQISQDKLIAKLLVKTARGGAPVSAELITEVITHAKIASELIDHKAIDRLLAAAPKATPGITLQIVIARGKAAIDGQNSQFKPLVQISQRRPSERTDGSLDYRDLGAIPSVNPGDILMRRLPPTKGADGYDVTGALMKAKDGRQIQFKHQKGSAVSEEDPNLLLATITGQPVMQPAGASVDPVLKVKDVNLRSGHIDYDGSLIVQGSVSSGMRIKVSGDAQIFGMVECADLSIGGNLDVKMGISGPSDDARQEGLVMRVQCGGNLSAGHVEKALLDVKGDITIKSQLTHSDTKCDHQLIVGSAGQPRSGIVGGRVQASKLIRAQTLGAEAGIATEAVIQCPAEKMRTLEDSNENIACKQADLGRLLKVMVDLSKTRAADIDERLKKINQTCDNLKKELSTITSERDLLQIEVDAMLESCIEVPGTVYPRVVVTIGDLTQEVMDKAEQVQFCNLNGRLVQRSLKPLQKGK